MPRAQTDYTQIEYNGRRLKYLVPSAIVINSGYFLFLYFVHYRDFISAVEIGPEAGVFQRADATAPFFIQLLVFVVLLVIAFIGLAYFRALGARGSFLMLAAATTLFLLTICVPMYFWGGSHKSMFGPLLAAVSALTVIVAETNKIRAIFGVACVIAFTILSLPGLAYEIVPNKGLISNGSQFTGVGLYLIFQTVSAIASIAIALALSWIHAKDKKTIFGDEEGRIHVLQVPATRRQKNDMLQTSIKVAIEMNAKMLSGGGVNYSECVTRLETEIQKLGQVFKQESVWCAEWSPSTEEIIRESLTSLANVPFDSSQIYPQVNELAKNLLAKKQPQWRNVFSRRKE